MDIKKKITAEIARNTFEGYYGTQAQVDNEDNIFFALEAKYKDFRLLNKEYNYLLKADRIEFWKYYLDVILPRLEENIKPPSHENKPYN